MENPIKMDDLGWNTPIFGNTYVSRDETRSFPPSLFFRSYAATPCEKTNPPTKKQAYLGDKNDHHGY